ncbi:carbohydrate ABC transporter permease [Sphingobium sp. YR768]|uniref:carbohydrate ABC transporter permease n=1 Tax=Sphingobium sp. YR768 TaxID=1884365 RepID=UPI0008D3665E|nr:carbohydrate ABC transporter permease [Sphingobium sp. YR768]SES19073.1 carbohydrate ABC transporter membrane protein 2, CUT1 family [Sphingobium sp. YR768]
MKPPLNSKTAAQRIATYAIVLLFVVIFVSPFLFMLMASFKPNQQIFSDLSSIRAFLPVGSISLQNYRDVIGSSGIGRFALNSAFITIVTVCAGLFVNSLAAFALARLEWRGKGMVLGLIVVLLIIPLEAIAVPMMLMVAYLPTLGFEGGLSIQWSWLDTRLVQIVPFVANAFSIFFFYQAFSDIPRDFDEAAYVDGATPFQVYRHVIVPLSGTTFATVAIIQGLAAWNQYLWPVIVVPSEGARPLMVGLQQFFRFQTEWGEVMAYATLATLPVFLAFIFFQRWFVQSVMGSGVKG